MVMESEAIACRECPLQDCEGLRRLEPEQLAAMQEFKRGEVALDAGEAILQPGQTARHLHTVLDGLLIRYRMLEEGRRQIVNFLFPGELVGLQAAFEEPVDHGVVALLPAKLCRFDRTDFSGLIAAHPDLALDIVWLAARQETELEGHLVAIGQRTAKERVAYLAVWLLDRAVASGLAEEDNRIALPIRQSQIADMLGLSLVHTNRTIKALERDGLVEWRPGEICVQDVEKAREFALYERNADLLRPFI